MNDPMDAEWEAWGVIVELTKGKAITFTEADWTRRANLPAETEGQKVIKAVQAWGERLVELRLFQARATR